MQYTHSSRSVYLLTYHFVFIVRYRHRVITDEIGDAMKLHMAELCRKSGCELISAEADRDHMHLLVSVAPDMAPSVLEKQLLCGDRRYFRSWKGQGIH